MFLAGQRRFALAINGASGVDRRLTEAGLCEAQTEPWRILACMVSATPLVLYWDGAEPTLAVGENVLVP